MPAERLDAWYIREVEREGRKESYWNRVGSAWFNRDGSINLHLDVVPLNGRIHLRKPKPRPESLQEESHPGPAMDLPPTESD
jgi:hypothetical protein